MKLPTPASSKQAALNAAPFTLAYIRPAAPPRGFEGDSWYRYVIVQGSNEIVGHRQGSLSDVENAVEGIVDSLNLRRAGRPGRVHLTRSPRRVP
jgi:hypothetical protein